MRRLAFRLTNIMKYLERECPAGFDRERWNRTKLTQAIQYLQDLLLRINRLMPADQHAAAHRTIRNYWTYYPDYDAPDDDVESVSALTFVSNSSVSQDDDPDRPVTLFE